ncbi:unnamed protein product, partial [Laminaria digitata]
KVHHVLKEHPYRKLALSLRRWSLSPSSSSPPPPPPPSSTLQRDPRHPRPPPPPPPHPSGLRVLGLTASYTYAVGDKKVEASLRSMCSELLVTNTETATSQELRDSGYHAVGAAAEVALDPIGARPFALPKGVVPVAARKPHEMGSTFFRRVREGRSTAFTGGLMACVRAMENAVSRSELPSFSSPLPPNGNLAPREWGTHAHKLARGGHGSKKSASTKKRFGAASARGKPAQLARPDAVLYPMLAELEHWYEATKTLVVTWEEAEDEAAMILDMGGCRARHSSSAGQRGEEETWPGSVRQVISAFWAKVPERFPRYEHLKDVLMENGGGDGGGSGGGGGGISGGRNGFRGVVFVQKRVTTHVLAHVLSIDPELAPLFSTACLYASSSPATASLSVTKSAAQAHLSAFRDGSVNLLLATVVAEEGMDIPAANCTIRFDAMEHAVSLVQGRGRARQAGSSFVVLRERSDRTTADLEAVEQQQLRLVRDFIPPLGGTDKAAHEVMLAAQRSREIGARAGASGACSAPGVASPVPGAVSAADLFSKKTKAFLEDSFKKEAGGLWVCTMKYESPLRDLHAEGKSPGKKIARRLAAEKLVTQLLAAVPA